MKSKRVINSICDKMKDIPADSLIKNYFPVDYIDSFSKVMVTGQALTPEDFRNLAFSRFPKWIGWLMNFRNAAGERIWFLKNRMIRWNFNQFIVRHQFLYLFANKFIHPIIIIDMQESSRRQIIS